MIYTLTAELKTGYKVKTLVISVVHGTCYARDYFHTARAAGEVNATSSEPGPGTRTVVDTDGKLTIGA